MFAGLCDVVGGHDVWIVEFRGRPTFLVEASDEVGVVVVSPWKNLDRDQSVERKLFREEDGGHRASAELANDLVSRNTLGALLRFNFGAQSIHLAGGHESRSKEGIRQASFGVDFPIIANMFEFVGADQSSLDHHSPEERLESGTGAATTISTTALGGVAASRVWRVW